MRFLLLHNVTTIYIFYNLWTIREGQNKCWQGQPSGDSLQALFCGSCWFSPVCSDKFLSNRSQYVVVDGCRSKLVNVVSWVPKGSVLGPQLFLLYTEELFSIVENKLYGYADDSTLVAVVPSPGERVAASESMNSDLNRVSVWCDMWRMNHNASKTKTMIVSRSHIIHPQLTPLSIGGTVLKESVDLVILGETFEAKKTFWEAPALCVKCCSSEIWYHEKVLAGLSWSVAPSEIFLELCLARFGVLLSSVVLSCRLTP